MAWLTDWSYRISHNLTGATGAGTYYQIQLSIYEVGAPFAENGISQPFHPSIIYPQAYYYNGKTYVVWQGDSGLDPYIDCYTHSTGTWEGPVKVGTNPLSDDDHGGPAVIVDNSGYIHVFYGSHNTAKEYAKSTNTEDISAWTAETDIGSATSYGSVIKDSSGVLWLFMRELVSGANHEYYRKSTDWTTSYQIITADSGDAIYMGNAEYDAANGRIHVAWCYYDASETKRLNIYHAYLKISDGHMYSMGGTDLGTAISRSEADTYCKIADSGGTYETNCPALHLNSNGYPYIIYPIDTATGWEHKFIKWNGNSWDAAVKITDSGHQHNYADFIINASNDIDAYLVTGSAAAMSGDLEKWHWNGSSWSKTKTILAKTDVVYDGLNAPNVVVNGVSGLQCVFCDTDVAVYTHYDLRVFAIDSSDNFLPGYGIIDCNGYCTDFPNDIRFTDNDGETELSHWGEDLTTDPVIFHVKVNDDLGSNQTVYMYCGKSGAASASSHTGTMIKADDGVSGNFDEIVKGTAALSHTSGKYKITSDSVDDAFSSGLVWDDWAKYAVIREFQPSSAGSNAGVIWVGLWDSATLDFPADSSISGPKRRFDITRYTAQTTTYANMVLIAYQDTGGTYHYWTGTAWTTTVTRIATSGNLEYRIWSDGTTLYADILSGGASIFTTVASIAIASVKAFSSGKCLAWTIPYTNVYYATQDIDNYFVRKYVDPEPTHGAWGEWEVATFGLSVTDSILVGDSSLRSMLAGLSITDGLESGDSLFPYGMISRADGVKLGDSLSILGSLLLSRTDGLTAGDSHFLYGMLSKLDGLKAGDSPSLLASLLASDGLKLGDTSSYNLLWSLIVAEGIKFSDSNLLSFIIPLIVTDGTKLGDSLSILTKLAISDGLELGDSPTRETIANLLRADGVELGDTATLVGALLYLAIVEGLKPGDTRLIGMQADVQASDGMEIGDSPLAGMLASLLHTDGLKAGDSVSRLVTMLLAATDGVKVGDAQLAEMLADLLRVDGVTLGDITVAGLTGIIYLSLIEAIKLGDARAIGGLGRLLRMWLLTQPYFDVTMEAKPYYDVSVETSLEEE